MPQDPPAAASSAPKFRQIVDALRSAIVDGEMPQHMALPSERTVAEEHGVSRMTARRALEAIEGEGLAYSEKRRGRFVSPRRLSYDISRMISLAAHAEAQGNELDIEIIDASEVQADTNLAQKLNVPVSEPLWAYTRLFRIAAHPIFIETEYVVTRLSPGLLRHDLRQSTTKLLEDAYGLQAHVGDIVIRMRTMQSEEVALLELGLNHPGIELEQVIRDKEGTPFCWGRQIWRGELAEFSARAMVNSSI